MENKLIFLDTETTGVKPMDRLCQLAYKCGDKEVNELFKPPLSIPPEASAVNHITNKMVDDKEVYSGSKTMKELQDMLDDFGIIIAHNAPFDIGMLKREGMVTHKRFIDTRKLAIFLDKESKLSGYSMQYIRYYLKLEIEADAHDAYGDIIVLEKIFNIFKDSMQKEFGDKTIEKMIEISTKPVLIKKMTFGKHKGKMMEDVPRDYLDWLYNNADEGMRDREDLMYTIDKILNT